MDRSATTEDDYIAQGSTVALRRVGAADLTRISRFHFTVSITEPLSDSARLKAVFETTGL